MFDMTKLKTRYFKLTLPDGAVIEVEPPKMKVLRKVLSLTDIGDEITEETLNDLTEGLSLALSKNKQNRKVTTKWITDNLDVDDMMALSTAYFEWVGEIQSSKN